MAFCEGGHARRLGEGITLTCLDESMTFERTDDVCPVKVRSRPWRSELKKERMIR